jgi:outer membrane cobalamin receptor
LPGQRAIWLVAAAALAPVSTMAQQPPAQKAAPKAAPKAAATAAPKPAPGKSGDSTVQGVTVTGQGGGYRSSIERRSYDVSKDLSTTTGSVADALRNVPSVEVDVNGAVSLRGDANVTIMIDGKPSGMFKGPQAGQALQSLPASQIERVEVVTNPSAAFSPEGSAGIINLVTKKGRGVGGAGSVRANLGSAGRRNVGMSGSYNSNRLTLSGDAGWRQDPQHSVNSDDRQGVDAGTGQTFTSHNEASNRGRLAAWNARVGIDYDLDAATRLSGELSHYDFIFHPNDLQHFEQSGPTGALTEVLDHFGEVRSDRATTAGQLGLRRKFAGDDHMLTVDLTRERSIELRDSRYTNVISLPAAPDDFRLSARHNVLTETELKADYSRPMPAEAKLKLGYDLRREDNRYDSAGVRGTSLADAAPDLSQTNLFFYKQTINAAYGTYEQPFGDWTVLAGLRLEDVRLDLDQVTMAQAIRRDDVQAYPSLHVNYRLSDVQQVTFSYSRRVQHPNPGDLNPFRSVGTFGANQGNPNLKDQDTHAFEAGWQLKDGATFYLATLYYRLNQHGVTDVVTDLGDGVLLFTKQNLSNSRNAGLELVANGKLTKTLSYNLSTNLYWKEINAAGAGLSGRRSAFVAGGRGGLSWQATPKDLIQLNATVNGKQLLPQGYVDPMLITFLGYRHKFSDRLSFVLTAQDLFNGFRYRQTLDTPTLHQITVSRGRIRAAFVGLNWSFGAATKKPQGFDFGGGAPQ